MGTPQKSSPAKLSQFSVSDGAASSGPGARLRVAWITGFPIEWLPDPEPWLRGLARGHPATWQRVLLGEFENHPALDLHIVALRKDFPRSMSWVRHGVTFHLIKTWPFVRAPSLFWLDTVLIRRIVRRLQPDVVHAWGTETGAALVASRLRGTPCIVTMQGILSWLGELMPLNAYHRFAARLERISLSRARHITVESAFGQRYLQEHFPAAQVRQIEHAPSPAFFSIVRAPQLAPMKIVTIGQLSFAKGGDLLIQALHSLRDEMDFRLTVIGSADPALFSQLRASTGPDLWSRIEFKGSLSSAEVAAELAAAAWLIHPTRGDNSPNAVKEAVVAGVPVVATRIGGIPDYVEEGVNGALFESGELNQCIAALRRMQAHPVLGQGRVDPDALARTRRYLAPARMAKSFFETYREVCGQMGRTFLMPADEKNAL